MVVLDGKQTSINIQDEIAIQVKQRVANGSKKPHLAAILVGSNVILIVFSSIYTSLGSN